MAELHTEHGSLWVDPLGARMLGCQLDGIWVMPDIRRQEPSFAAGEQLFPWPNRLRDGRWNLDGASQQLELTEPARSNAIHGLLRSVPFSAATTADTLTLQGELRATVGYPFDWRISFAFTMAPGELAVRTSFTLQSTTRAPWAFGSHPYICLDREPAEVHLQVAADRVWNVDAQMIPIELVAVTDLGRDLRADVPLAHLEVDHGFERSNPAEPTVATLSTADHALEVWADPEFSVVQVFRPPLSSSLHDCGGTVAIEPMTAPADAFNSGVGLRWAEPGETTTLSWGVRLRQRR